MFEVAKEISFMLFFSIVAITLALVLYTSGVWAERRSQSLQGWHVALFGSGLFFDGLGTYLMSILADENTQARTGLMAVMAVTGAVALILMAAHFLWAWRTYRRGTDEQKTKFHRYSVIVWAIWLVPYFTGAAGAMMG